jgi:hypothetical protein
MGHSSFHHIPTIEFATKFERRNKKEGRGIERKKERKKERKEYLMSMFWIVYNG